MEQYAKRILALYGEMDGSLRELTDDMAGTLMLGASMTIAEYDLPRLLVRFKEMFPEVNVKLLMSNTDGIVQMVIENRIDLGLVEGPVHNRSLTVRRYDVDRLVIALRPGHPLAGEDRVPLEACAEYHSSFASKGRVPAKCFWSTRAQPASKSTNST